MVILGLETSGRSGSIALQIDGQLRREVDLSATGRRHARNLVPEVQSLLREFSLAAQDVDLLAVGVGPGSFTGLRVGLTFAKLFAWSTSCKLVAVDTFAAVALASGQKTPLWVIDDALRGDVFAGRYSTEINDDGASTSTNSVTDSESSGLWKSVVTPHLLSFEEWKSTLPPDAFISGPGLKTYGNDLAEFQLADETLHAPRAREVAQLGEQMGTLNLFADPWTLTPFYMRRSAAEEKADGPQSQVS